MNRPGCYKIVAVNHTGKLYFVPGSTRMKNIEVLYKFTLKSNLDKKAQQEIKNNILNTIDNYNKGTFICYTRACSKYGKKNVTDYSLIMEVDNPYYKCAAPMRIYDKKMIEYKMKVG